MAQSGTARPGIMECTLLKAEKGIMGTKWSKKWVRESHLAAAQLHVPSSPLHLIALHDAAPGSTTSLQLPHPMPLTPTAHTGAL